MTGGGQRAAQRRPHVLVVASAAEGYGADRMLLHSVQALIDTHRITVVLPQKGPLQDRLQAAGAAVELHRDFALRRKYLAPARLPGLLARNLDSVRRLRARHRRDPFDLVVTNTQAVVLGAALAWVIRRPHVWHVHEIVDDPPAFARAMVAFIHRSTDRVIACSTAVHTHLVTLRPELAARTTVVTNAIAMPPTVDQAGLRSSGPIRVGCVGRIHRRKGQRELVEAWVQLAARLEPPDAVLELHFFGEPLDGEEEIVSDLWALLTEAGCAQQAHFHGFSGDPAAIYPALDIVVVPSIEPESFSLVCAEAQAYGLPVIGPDRGGPAETILDERTGLQVDPTDINALAAALARLVRDEPERRRLGAAGRDHALASFSLVRYHREIRAVVAAALMGTTPAMGPVVVASTVPVDHRPRRVSAVR